MSDNYRTITKNAQAEFVEKKSRFIAYVRKVSTEDDARAFIEEIKKKHWDATHNVFAYQVGEGSEIQRFSDDGEPAGTAGRPILDVLKKNRLQDSLIAVVRYFGGILLGAGGLTRAYSDSAAGVVKSSGCVFMCPKDVYLIQTDYSTYKKIAPAVKKRGEVIAVEYANDVKATVACEENTPFGEYIRDVSAGKVAAKRLRTEYFVTEEA